MGRFDEEERSGCRGWLTCKNCCSCLLIGCLLLSITCGTTIYFVPGMIKGAIAPLIISLKLRNAGAAMGLANDYLKGEEGPLPDDVSLSPALEAISEERGFENYFGRYYETQSCIAAADREGVRRQDLCALMDLEGGWPAGEIKAMSYVVAAATAQGLLYLGYDPDEPEIKKELVDEDGNVCEEGDEEEECLNPILRCANRSCEAFLSYFGENQENLDVFSQLSDFWQVAETADVDEPGLSEKPTLEEILRWFSLVIKYKTLKDLGLDTLIIYGQVTDDIIVLPIPPPVPDDVYRHPYPGSHPTSYNWLQPVIIDGVFRINHPGQDFGRNDDYGKTVGHPIVALHNSEVTYAQVLSAATGLAAHWWISGLVIVTYKDIPDALPMCVFYGHGAIGTLIVGVGQDVGAGQQLFNAGSTGFSSDVHLHLAIKRGGEYPYCEGGGWVDPNPYVNLAAGGNYENSPSLVFSSLGYIDTLLGYFILLNNGECSRCPIYARRNEGVAPDNRFTQRHHHRSFT